MHLNDHHRLSRSPLWEWQRSWFDVQGIRAWSEAAVPQYVTSNPYIATSYAQVVAGWLRDALPEIDPQHPLDVIELGCGSGRFGYLFLRRLLALAARIAPGIRIRYVFTDFTEYNLDVLRSHPSLQPLVEQGQVDFARFDVERDTAIHLSANPLVVIANYVFDGVRNDYFRITDDGALEEGLVHAELPAPAQEEDEPKPQLDVSCEFTPVASANYYDDPSWNAILRDYARGQRGTALLFPTAALTCLQRLRELSGDRLLLLSADKGNTHEETLRDSSELHLAVHGSVSLMVNYHAIGQWVAAAGGRFLRTSHRRSSLHIVAALFGIAGHETEAAYGEWIERRAPDDYYAMKRAVEEHCDALTPHQLMAFARFSEWDYTVLLGAMPMLMQLAETASPLALEELRELARNTWAGHFPLREPIDVAFQAAMLLLAAQSPREALALFEESIRWYGPDAATSTNMAVCHLALRQLPEATEHVRAALALDPEAGGAKALLEAIEQERAAGG